MGFLAEQMLASPADSYTLIYNKFQSVMTQEVTSMEFKGPEALGGYGVFDEYEFEGDKEVVLADLYQFNLACSLHGCDGLRFEQRGRHDFKIDAAVQSVASS